VARFKHVTTGAVVDVRDGKVMGSEWETVNAASTPPAKKTAERKPAAKK
jgi:hypothetical protein